MMNVWEALDLGKQREEAASIEQNEFETLQAAREEYRERVGIKKTRLVCCKSLLEKQDLGVGALYVKDEGNREGLPAFKILGVSFAVDQLMREGSITTICTMTDGNHGMALAATAKQCGLESVVYVPENMSKPREEAIKRHGARVVRIKGTYDDAISMVRSEAKAKGWLLVSDTSWEGYTRIPRMIVAGYGTLFKEVEEDASGVVFTHVVVQAGVGGLASAAAAWLHSHKGSNCWSEDVSLILVEPMDAACCFENARAGFSAQELRPCSGSTNSIMSGLNCGMPSIVAWPLIHRTVSHYVIISDEWAKDAMRALAEEGIVAGESGAAGLAGLMSRAVSLPSKAKVLVLNTESDTDPIQYAEIIGLARS